MQIRTSELAEVIVATAVCTIALEGVDYHPLNLIKKLDEARVDLILYLRERPKGGFSSVLFDDDGSRIRTHRVGKLVNLAHDRIKQEITLAGYTCKSIPQTQALHILHELMGVMVGLRLESEGAPQPGVINLTGKPLPDYAKDKVYDPTPCSAMGMLLEYPDFLYDEEAHPLTEWEAKAKAGALAALASAYGAERAFVAGDSLLTVALATLLSEMGIQAVYGLQILEPLPNLNFEPVDEFMEPA